ncbi:hypothetical protein ACWDWO_00665 [Actinopolymorpha singaporensis]
MSARARRRRLTSTFTTDTLTTLALLAGLLTAFVVLARIGLADIPGALTFVGRLTGGLAVLAAVLVGVATLAVTDYRAADGSPTPARRCWSASSPWPCPRSC